MRKGAKIEFARKLRKTMTDAETRLWFHLRRRQLNGFRFRKQHPLGIYVVDFICVEELLVVEVDGGQHLESTSDAVRDRWLCEKGFRVLRFWNNDVLARTDIVLAEIMGVLTAALPPSGLRPPSPAAQGKGKTGVS